MAATSRRRPKYSRKKNPDGRMRLADHLIEFRNRFIICAIAVVIAMIGGFLLTDLVLDIIRRPIEILEATRSGRVSINFANVTTGFDLRLQIALTLGVVIASPVWLYQVWMFLMPGLKKGERRYVLGFLGAAIPLFLGGVVLGFVLMPRMVEVMAMFVPEDDTVFYDAKTFYSFVLTLCLAVGVAFVVPVLLVMLNFAGILSGRTILKGWRIAILIAALFGAISTPAADVLSMILLMVPMIALYFLAVGIALLHDRRQRKRDERLGIVDPLAELPVE
ncbi:twin-arginine translocase subunit TatC [Gulosibacter sp. 10]|uniref:twin-arginine translocase subunit TatC n=1 Tax=Gulosibacter sp. 10 TaxID=1255570 RepID=UPI00097EF1F9|nr:twin-arginine translocase subunit TatC [Gulosibacter sp. 10]SJM52805.1 Twin-arginine translocation protein TatC [Gulosibacter sp. 10]